MCIRDSLDTAITLIPLLDDDGNPVFETDPDTGLPLVDDDGNPILVLDTLEVPFE